MRQPLTKRQREILDWLALQIAANGYAPSLEEIGKHFGLSSLATVHKHLENIQDRGHIARRYGRCRSIEIVADSGCCPTCGRAFDDVLIVSDQEVKATEFVAEKA